jgi:hypothetical protein
MCVVAVLSWRGRYAQERRVKKERREEGEAGGREGWEDKF